MTPKRFVMIPGPTPVVRSIQTEMGRETTAFGDPLFVQDYKALIDDLNQMWNNQSGKCFVLAATGTFAMEMAIANSTKPDDNVLVVSTGFFGDRFIEICERKGRNVDALKAEWGTIVKPEEIEKKLSEKNYAAMTVTHVDTSTGVKMPIEAIGNVMKKYPETLFIVDGVCSTAAELENVDDMGIDILFTGSQKAFGVAPGMAILWANRKALDRRESLGTISEYYCDYAKWIPIMDDPMKYFATPAVNMVWALKEAVRIIKEEGLTNRNIRTTQMARATQKALESLGFRILAEEANRAITLTCFLYPEGVEDGPFRSALIADDVIVAGALGAYAGKAFRMGHMGNAGFPELVTTIAAIEKNLYAMGKHSGTLGTAVGVFIKEMV